MREKIIIYTAITFLTGCSGISNLFGDSDKQLLPDSGMSTVDLIQGRDNAENAYFGGTAPADYVGQPIVTGASPSSSYSNNHITELQRDFKKVPNPDVIGYVYPHINDNEMPVPGYFTTFKLYDKDHFALTSEGHNE